MSLKQSPHTSVDSTGAMQASATKNPLVAAIGLKADRFDDHAGLDLISLVKDKPARIETSRDADDRRTHIREMCDEV